MHPCCAGADLQGTRGRLHERARALKSQGAGRADSLRGAWMVNHPARRCVSDEQEIQDVLRRRTAGLADPSGAPRTWMIFLPLSTRDRSGSG